MHNENGPIVTARLPTPGGDDGRWGDLLNNFLSVGHNDDGTLKNNALITGAEQKTNKGVANGYASLDTNGLVPDSELAIPLSTVGDYIGLMMNSVTIPTNTSGWTSAVWDTVTVNQGNSLTWDSSQPGTMVFTNTGVYSISLTVDWIDSADTSGTSRYATLFSNCLFRTTDSRASVTDLNSDTVQSVSLTAYWQAGQDINVELQHFSPLDLQPYVLMLITRLS